MRIAFRTPRKRPRDPIARRVVARAKRMREPIGYSVLDCFGDPPPGRSALDAQLAMSGCCVPWLSRRAVSAGPIEEDGHL